MRKIHLIAVGRLKEASLLSLFQEYKKRLTCSFDIKEIDHKPTKEQEASFILEKIPSSSFVIVLDERGKALSSPEFAKTLSGQSHVTFIIGGAEGLSQSVRDRADLCLSFGPMTWPHLWVRILLAEQIYRAQQILKGHPYHK